MFNFRSAVAFFSIVLLAGCATIFDGQTQTVTFDSTPSGAEVQLNGVTIGKTPFSSEVKREKGNVLTFTKEGYEDRVVPMVTTMNLTFLGNLVTGGAFGTTTDAASGAINKYEPGQYMVSLVKIDS